MIAHRQTQNRRSAGLRNSAIHLPLRPGGDGLRWGDGHLHRPGLVWRVQHHGRNTGKCRTPPAGARQILDRHWVIARPVVVIFEYSRISAGGIALKIDLHQAVAIIERIVADAGDAVENRDVGQAVA